MNTGPAGLYRGLVLDDKIGFILDQVSHIMAYSQRLRAKKTYGHVLLSHTHEWGFTYTLGNYCQVLANLPDLELEI